MHIFYKESYDAFKKYPQKIKKYRENLVNNKLIWKKYNIIPKYSKNKLNFMINDSENKIYEIPIFALDSLDEHLIKWILSFELNDIIRIMVENNLLFHPNGTLNL